MEWEAQDEGVMAKILVGDGAQDVQVGTPVAILVDDKADVRPAHLLTGPHFLMHHILVRGHVPGDQPELYAHSCPVSSLLASRPRLGHL